MTRNEFILHAMISMAGDERSFNIGPQCVVAEAKNVAKAAKILADAAVEAGAYFDVDIE